MLSDPVTVRKKSFFFFSLSCSIYREASPEICFYSDSMGKNIYSKIRLCQNVTQRKVLAQRNEWGGWVGSCKSPTHPASKADCSSESLQSMDILCWGEPRDHSMGKSKSFLLQLKCCGSLNGWIWDCYRHSIRNNLKSTPYISVNKLAYPIMIQVLLLFASKKYN